MVDRWPHPGVASDPPCRANGHGQRPRWAGGGAGRASGAGGADWVIRAFLRTKRRIAPGPVRSPPRPESAKEFVPTSRVLNRVRKVSWRAIVPALTRSAIAAASAGVPAMTEADRP